MSLDLGRSLLSDYPATARAFSRVPLQLTMFSALRVSVAGIYRRSLSKLILFIVFSFSFAQESCIWKTHWSINKTWKKSKQVRLTRAKSLQRLPSNGLCSDYPATARTSSEIDWERGNWIFHAWPWSLTSVDCLIALLIPFWHKSSSTVKRKYFSSVEFSFITTRPRRRALL